MTSRESNTRFERALTELQVNWLIAPVGVAEAGAWRYAFIYESVTNVWPKLAAQAERITRREARAKILDLYLASVGAVTAAQAHKLLHWPKADLQAAFAALVDTGEAREVDAIGATAGPWWVSAALLAAPARSSAS